jgi:TPR repeat protein
MTILGSVYSAGRYVPLDMSEAFRWYIEAARLGHAQAQYNVGDMYAYGKGVPKNFAEAFQWLAKAAAQGDVGALYMVGSMQIEGHGTPQDRVSAYEYLSLAANQGNERAGAELVVLQFKMTPQEIEKAKTLARAWTPRKTLNVPW